VAYQCRIRSLVSGNWAKEVDISNLKISSWTGEQDEAWISNLADVKKPPNEGFDASILESVAYLERKKEWDEQYGALLQIAKNHNCDLVPIVTPQS
jgi:ketopantoate reductase